MRILPFLIFNFLFGNTNAQVDGNTSPTYSELIQTYKKLADEHDEIEFFSMGESDYGLPIYLLSLIHI